jgi:hypothetical protein
MGSGAVHVEGGDGGIHTSACGMWGWGYPYFLVSDYVQDDATSDRLYLQGLFSQEGRPCLVIVLRLKVDGHCPTIWHDQALPGVL